MPPKGTVSLNPSKRKPLDKGDRPPKKPKLVTRSTVGETQVNKLPLLPRPGKGKSLMTNQGLVIENAPSSSIRTCDMLSSNSHPSLRTMIMRTWVIIDQGHGGDEPFQLGTGVHIHTSFFFVSLLPLFLTFVFEFCKSCS